MGKRGGTAGGGKRGAVKFIDQDEPAFIKRMKSQTGYQEPPDENQKNVASDGGVDRPDTEEEQPQVVVLKSGHLTKEEAEVAKTELEIQEEQKPYDGEKITFKKPDLSAKSELNVFSQKTTKKGDNVEKLKNNTKPIKNKCLLSFDDEEEEEEED